MTCAESFRTGRAACALAWFVSSLCACGVNDRKPQRVAAGDAALFEGYVQPYLEVRCASLDCHGAAGRPMRLYSELGLRKDAALRQTPTASNPDPTPITNAELVDNRRAIAGISPGVKPPTSHLALHKPLALSAGGIAHKGGVHWPSQKHPGYLCLRGYLAGDVDDVMAECARALATATP